jgi:hypothetical protein
MTKCNSKGKDKMHGHAQRTVLTRRRSPPANVLGDFFE